MAGRHADLRSTLVTFISAPRVLPGHNPKQEGVGLAGSWPLPLPFPGASPSCTHLCSWVPARLGSPPIHERKAWARTGAPRMGSTWLPGEGAVRRQAGAGACARPNSHFPVTGGSPARRSPGRVAWSCPGFLCSWVSGASSLFARRASSEVNREVSLITDNCGLLSWKPCTEFRQQPVGGPCLPTSLAS